MQPRDSLNGGHGGREVATMAEKRFTLIGKQLSPDELARFPQNLRFTKAQTAAWVGQNATELLSEEVFHQLDRLSMLMITSLNVQCPVGPHDDPGLDVAVLRACGIQSSGKVSSVAVQCSQGHWAEYPCG